MRTSRGLEVPEYRITVLNPANKEHGVREIRLNGDVVDGVPVPYERLLQ